MYPEMYNEQVVYQNPFLAMRIWQIDSKSQASEAVRQQLELDWKHKRFVKWHYHKEVEFLLVIRGELTVFSSEEQVVLREGDIALFGTNEPHISLQTDSQLLYFVFQIDLHKYWDQSTLNSMKHFSEVIRPLSTLNYIYRDNPDVRDQTSRLIREIYQEMNDQEIGYELAVSSRIKNMLLLLLRHDTERKLHYSDNNWLDRMQPALDYMDKHLNEKLSVDELSKKMNMSYTYFIKMFKKAVGMPFTDFVTYKRIKRAEQKLLTQDISVSEVAESVGFTNLGHFYDMFRRYNDCTPREFKGRLP
ncbi:AraC family transcriptional regulator [Cohnella silvisoli]|uniref:AraC family transcriptional regulator n=1 Tax=Cohnella silvisoli TaxID=2873699 RepID=A0ABV1KLA0_9BACL|nr:AraC family transcriptional regulator [Cohnella silvisoli]MCD9020761.1 AraC family transcriptional regulator [Cohnella silvisoli]